MGNLTEEDLSAIGNMIEAKHASMREDIAIIRTKVGAQTEKWRVHDVEHADMKIFLREVNNKANVGVRIGWAWSGAAILAGAFWSLLNLLK